MKSSHILLLYFVYISYFPLRPATEQKSEKPSRKLMPKDPLFMTDIDLENLYEQWEEKDDDILPPDELEPHKRPTPKLDESLLQRASEDPNILRNLAKKGKTVMAFVNVAGRPTRRETEDLTQRWQMGLQNNHVRVQRFIIEDNRAMFVFEDGAQAFEYKDFLLSQPELSEYVIDGQSFHGKGYPVEYLHSKNSTANVEGKKDVQQESLIDFSPDKKNDEL